MLPYSHAERQTLRSEGLRLVEIMAVERHDPIGGAQQHGREGTAIHARREGVDEPQAHRLAGASGKAQIANGPIGRQLAAGGCRVEHDRVLVRLGHMPARRLDDQGAKEAMAELRRGVLM